jgi:hypothetical protein
VFKLTPALVAGAAQSLLPALSLRGRSQGQVVHDSVGFVLRSSDRVCVCMRCHDSKCAVVNEPHDMLALGRNVCKRCRVSPEFLLERCPNLLCPEVDAVSHGLEVKTQSFGDAHGRVFQQAICCQE